MNCKLKKFVYYVDVKYFYFKVLIESERLDGIGTI